ncbi:MAG: DNRLRE domain-containing protein, partial [Candidatus Methylomirabilales bacterium]
MTIRQPSRSPGSRFACLGLLLLGLLAVPPPARAQGQALAAAQDTYLRRFLPNRNHGAQGVLRVLALVKNRALLHFDEAAIATAVGRRTLVAATLRLHLTRTLFLGKTGRDIAVHRMRQAWTEQGATWNCPDDANPTNFRPDCSRWNMRQMRQWPFAATPTAVARHVRGQTGWVAWDVTADVAAFLAGTAANVGWIVKAAEEFKPGFVAYSSREGAFPPELVLEITAPPEPTLPAGFGIVLGRVIDASTEQPLAGTTVKALGTPSETVTDTEGRFALPAPQGPRVPVYVNQGGYVDAKAFTVVEAGRESTVGTVRLQPFDPVTTLIDSTGGSHTDSTGTVQVIFPAGAVGTTTAVTATVFPTPQEFPVQLPEGQAYLAGVQFTPEHLSFATPVTVRIQNTLHLPPGTAVPFAYANHGEDDPQMVFFDPGMARVSADGQFLEADLPHFSCIALAPPFTENRAPLLTKSGDKSSESSKQKTCCPIGSRVGAQDGTLFLDQTLPATRTLGRSTPLTFTYSSATAAPHPLIATEALLDPTATN